MKKSSNKKNSGFTLIELSISFGLMAVLLLLVFVPIQMSTSATSMAMAKDKSQGSVRDVVQSLRRELEMATDGGSVPLGVFGATVTQDGADVALGNPGNEFTVQIPLVITPDTAADWSSAITYQFINEDDNGNGRRDAGEADDDGNGVLSRRLVRLQDLDGNGNFNGVGETRVLDAANSFANITFTLNADNDMVTINLTATENFHERGRVNEEGDVEADQTTAQLTSQIYLLN